MNLTELVIDGYQGVNRLHLSFREPVTLIAGKNASGKTTVRDAITFALTGQSSRVRLKKDYDSLVRRGSDPKKAQVALTLGGFTWRRSVVTGKVDGDERDVPLVLPYLLGNESFTELDRSTQNKLLIGATKTPWGKEVVTQMLADRGIEEQVILELGPMLRSGFSAAEKFCKDKQSEARGGWQAITGETFGTKKAEGWEPPVDDTNAAEIEQAIEDAKAGLEDLDKDLEAARAQEAAHPQHTHGSGVVYECPECGSKLVVVTEPEKGPRLEKDTRKQKAKPDIEALKAAKQKITDLGRERASLQQRIGQLKGDLSAVRNADAIRAEKKEKAAMYLEVYGWWGAAAEALSPSGIPLEITERAIKSVNERLARTGEITGWPLTEFQSDLSIEYGGLPYGLCSESEQWRIDAAVSEALSYLSGVKFFVLDRMDVLHPEGRVACIKWLQQAQEDHDSIIILATLKSPPEVPGIQCEWLEEGGQLRRAA